MPCAFITGIPTAGKSYLAKRVAEKLGCTWISMDDVIVQYNNDPVLAPWVNFFWNKDEDEYYRATSEEEQWQNIVNQSEAFWPTIKTTIEAQLATGRSTIFEGVNLLPHLMHKLALPGVVLLGESEETTLRRLQEKPRWGETPSLQTIEAHAFFAVEGSHYKSEAEKYGYPAFHDVDAAQKTLEMLILHD